jgi:hypothetical protein
VNPAARRAYLKEKFRHPDAIDEVVNTAFARRTEAAIREWHRTIYQHLTPTQKSKIKTVAGVYDDRYGTFAVCVNSKARPGMIARELQGSYTNCAEAHGANQLLVGGSNFHNLRFVQPMAPDRFIGGLIPKEFCNECISTFFLPLRRSPVYEQSPRPMLGGPGEFFPYGVP